MDAMRSEAGSVHNFPNGDSMAFGVGNLVGILLGRVCNTGSGSWISYPSSPIRNMSILVCII